MDETAHGVPFLRAPAYDAAPAPRRRRGRPTPDPAAHAAGGGGGGLTVPADERGEPGAPDLSLPAARPRHREGGRDVVRRHHLCPSDAGVFDLVAVMDWATRHVLAWRLSNTMDATFFVGALDDAFIRATPEILNTDQDAQFTSAAFADRVLAGEEATPAVHREADREQVPTERRRLGSSRGLERASAPLGPGPWRSSNRRARPGLSRDHRGFWRPWESTLTSPSDCPKM